MVYRKRKNKGKIVWDECANILLKPSVREAGWQIIPIKLKDTELFHKYGKGTYPVFTSDTTAYEFNSVEKGAIGFIVHENFTEEELPSYSLKVKEAMANMTAKATKYKVWKIPKNRKPTIIKKLA